MASGKVRKGCTCDRAFWIGTDVLQDAQVVMEFGHYTEECRARTEQEKEDKGAAMKLETSGQHKVEQEPDVSLKWRKIVEPDQSR